MNFKEQIQKDLDIFINLDEFGEKKTLTLNRSKKVFEVVVDDDSLKKRTQKQYDGIIEGDILYFIKQSDLGNIIIKSGDLQFINGVPYTVIDVKLDLGLYEVLLQAKKS